ncbi:MAG: hypothetical protein MRK01_14945 [Candidatus Scalindua sp.]|nr:hypothetical protein [Candidatus Scalindua sp.]
MPTVITKAANEITQGTMGKTGEISKMLQAVTREVNNSATCNPAIVQLCTSIMQWVIKAVIER